MSDERKKMTPLYVFYFVATSWEYIMDIAPIKTQKIGKIQKKPHPVINK